MSKSRYIDTNFWDDEYIAELTPIEKLLYLYFLTNEKTNIAGIYQITIKRMNYDTSMAFETIKRILEKFSKDKKITYVDGWIIICNFLKYQKIEKNPKIKIGIQSILNELPSNILRGIHTASIPYTYPPNYFNFNFNFNNNNLTTLNVKKLSPSKSLITPKKGKTWGKKEINELIALFKEKTKLEEFGESYDTTRKWGNTLVNKYTMEQLEDALDWLLEDDFWHNNLTKLSQLYYQMPRYLRETDTTIEKTKPK